MIRLAPAAALCLALSPTPIRAQDVARQATEAPAPTFVKRTLTKDFVSEGATAADFDRDGHVDACVGRFIWLGPDFARRVPFAPARAEADGTPREPYRADVGYSDSFAQFACDFTGDGWTDVLVYGAPGAPASIFVHPGRAPLDDAMDWARHDVVDVADGESPDLVDVTGDGRPELLCFTGGQFGFFEIDWSDPPRSVLAKARFHAITAEPPEGGRAIHRYTHGYGAGDVNGDGRIDVVTSGGWYEQPGEPDRGSPWRHHAADFGEGGAQMYVLDVNGDGRADVVTSIRAHGYGLSWFEQRADGSFVDRPILGRTAEENAGGLGFSQIHALCIADVDVDGLPDVVAGKRRWAHGPLGDEDPAAPPVLCWFELARDPSAPGGARFVKHAIDGDSGVGTQFWTGELDGDGRIDVVVGNKHGAFVLTRRARAAAD